MAVYPTPGLRNRTCIIAGLLSLSAGVAQASSFALIEQSVSGMGSAYAIGAAGLDDASTLYFNPAGMSRLSGSNLSTGLQIVSSSVDWPSSASCTSPSTVSVVPSRLQLPGPSAPAGLCQTIPRVGSPRAIAVKGTVERVPNPATLGRHSEDFEIR